MSKTISFYTLGCRLNQAETASILNSFEHEGFNVVDFKQSADIVVINTCTVTQNGDADTRRLVYKANRLNPNVRIALIGCQAQIQKEQLTSLPNVQWVVGNERKMELAKIFRESNHASEPQVIAPAIERKSFRLPFAAINRQRTRANIKIQDGCDFFCSFCEIPYARGRARSRIFEDIKLEAEALVAAGYKELILTGINIGTYDYKGKALADVIDQLVTIEDLKRIRISSIEPTTVAESLIPLMAGDQKLCGHLHMPVQSGHDDILGLMNRKHTVQDFRLFVEKVHRADSRICIGTDVIVGFPGESDQHFESTLELIEEAPVHHIHVFSYSARLRAKSQLLAQPVSEAVIQRRSQKMRKLSQIKRQAFFRSLLGGNQDVLFEQRKGRYWFGLTENYVKIRVETSKDLHNEVLPVILKDADDQGIIGQLVL